MECVSNETNNELTDESTRLSALQAEIVAKSAALAEEQRVLEAKLRETTIEGVSIANFSADDMQAQLLTLYREKSENEEQNAAFRRTLQEKCAFEADLRREIDELNARKAEVLQRIDEEKERKNLLQNRMDDVVKDINFAKEEIAKRTKEVERIGISFTHYKNQVAETTKYIAENQRRNIHRALTKCITNISAHQRGITSIAFTPDYKSFVTAGEDCYVKKWGLPSLEENFSLYVKSTPSCIRLNPESYFVAFPCADKIIRIFDFNTWRSITELKSHLEICTDVLWTSRNQLISTSKDRTVKLFDLSKSACTATINAISASFSITPTGNPSVFAIGCFDGNIKMVDTRIKKAIQLVKTGVHSKSITSLITDPTKDKIYSIGLDNKVTETSISGANVVRKMECPSLIVKNHLARISIDPYGGYLAAGSDNGNVILFDLFKDKSDPIVLKYHENPVVCTAFSGNMLISTDKKGNVGFWN